MPQLDPSSYISQIFWLTVTFLSLWFVMSVFIIPKIKNIIDEREQKIAEYIGKAESINKQANDALKRYEKAVSEAKNRTALQIAENRAEIEKMLQKKQDEADRIFASQIAENEQILKQEREETLKLTEEIAQKIAQTILKKIGFDETMQDKSK